MESFAVVHSVAALLLVVSTVFWHRGLPSVNFGSKSLITGSKSLITAWKSLLRNRRTVRPRRVAMRGARPWWK